MVENSAPGEVEARDGREELGFALSRELTPTRLESLENLLPFSKFLDFCVSELPPLDRDQSQGELSDTANAAEAAISLGVSEFLSTGKLDTFVSDASGNFLHIPPAYWGGFHAYRPLAGAGFCADADLHGSLAGEVDGRPIFIEEVQLKGLAAAPPADVPVRMRPQVSGPALKEWVGKKIKETWGFPGPAATKGRPVTNVRNLASPFWRSALSNVERRCIVPVTRFCEWTAEPDPETKRKRKVWFGMHEDHEPLFAFAGLWRPAEGGPFMAFLTCEPNQTVGAIHPKAMPVILGRDDLDSWLSDPHETACSLARPYNDDLMRVVD